MTRVLVIEPAGGLWGSERALLDLIQAATDLEIAVCCPPGAPLIAELQARGVRVEPYFIADLHTKSRWQRLRAAVGVARACLSFTPDVIHLNQSGAYKVVLPAAALLDLPIIGHVRIFEDVAYLARQTPDPRRLKALIAISDAIETEIRSQEALRTIPLHRVFDGYALAPRGSEAAEHRMPGRIACVGRITPIKGQEVLLGAMAMTDLLPGDLECLMVGDGEEGHLQRLRDIAPEETGAQIRWIGFVQDVGALLKTCRVLVCPSHREPLGRVILEAWDAGAVPVAYAGAGGAAEIISAAQGGIIYQEQTPECLASALATALALPERDVDQLVANGRAWMAEHCGTELYSRTLTAVFDAAGKPR
jgi:glycosyltransferase involved in cell wall biosynthesis